MKVEDFAGYLCKVKSFWFHDKDGDEMIDIGDLIPNEDYEFTLQWLREARKQGAVDVAFHIDFDTLDWGE